jgi:hypothetical protein
MMISVAQSVFIVLIVLATVAVWAWSHRRRHQNRSSPPVTGEAAEETSAAACKPEAPTTQTDDFIVPAPAPEVADDVLPSEPSTLQPLYSRSTTLTTEQTPERSHLPLSSQLLSEEPVSGTEAPNPIRVLTDPMETPATSNPSPAPETVAPSVLLTIPREENSPVSVTTQKCTATSPTPLEPTTTPSLERRETHPSPEPSQHGEASEADHTARPPIYRPLAAPATTTQSRSHRAARADVAPNSKSELRIRVQLVFGRGGAVRALALVPDRRNGMPSEVEVNGTQGELCLAELRDDCYDPIPLEDASNALRQGVDWRGRDGARKWRWVLGGRELYVLGPGDEVGLHGFVSTARLRLNARHVVLATLPWRGEVLAALAATGCRAADVSDDTTPGVPSGWLLFRDVVPTRPVPMRNEHDILNALCPASEIEPHFVGGIRLEMRVWLAGFPPRIRLTGELTNGFELKIDNQTAQCGRDGAFEARGWDSEGEHRLWFGNRTETYRIRRMGETWRQWNAHNFGLGPPICGASVFHSNGPRKIQIRIPCSNPLLLGAHPGEVFSCPVRRDVRCENTCVTVPFAPVWALPADPAHADRRSARIMLYQSSEPHVDITVHAGSRPTNRRLVSWIAAIHNAGCKGLQLEPGNMEAKALWRRYRLAAKHLRRSMR